MINQEFFCHKKTRCSMPVRDFGWMKQIALNYMNELLSLLQSCTSRKWSEIKSSWLPLQTHTIIFIIETICMTFVFFFLSFFSCVVISWMMYDFSECDNFIVASLGRRNIGTKRLYNKHLMFYCGWICHENKLLRPQLLSARLQRLYESAKEVREEPKFWKVSKNLKYL